MAETRLTAQVRDPKKTSGVILRRAGMVPGVYYNRSGETRWLQFDENTLNNLLKHEIGLLRVDVDGESLSCIIREVQRHPVRRKIIHIDLMGIAADQRIKSRVPIHAVGLAIGVKEHGGTLELVLREVEVECLPADLPTHIDVEVSALAINEGVRISEIQIPGVTIIGDSNMTLVHVIPPRAVEEEKPVAAAPEAAEPEVIRERKTEEEPEKEKEKEKEKGKEKK
jgi:large subunit ribosomal protein L25